MYVSREGNIYFACGDQRPASSVMRRKEEGNGWQHILDYTKVQWSCVTAKTGECRTVIL